MNDKFKHFLDIIKTLTISDIHLGHNKTKTKFIIENLDRYFKDNIRLFKQLHILFIDGDIFHKLVQNGTQELDDITQWFTRIVLFCKMYNIKLRVLEGTKSHDYNQMKTMATMIDELLNDIDFKYIDTVYIEKMDDIDFTILYVPDEINHDAKVTFKQVQELMKAQNLTKVDVTHIHGQFHFQLPMAFSTASHTEEDYLNITKYFISCAHIHTSMIYDRIVGQGSFDRTAHGEEKPKGAMYMEIDRRPNADSRYQFIENKYAKKYITHKVTETDFDTLRTNIVKKLLTIPKGSHFRLKIGKNDPLVEYYTTLKREFSDYHWDIKKEDDDKDKQHNESLLKTNKLTVLTITKDNVTELVENELDGVDKDLSGLILKELKTIL